MTQQITAAADALKFLLAGNAVVTLKSLKSGNHITFKVRAPKEPRAGGPSHFVQVRTAPTGKGSFTYLGMMRDGRFWHGQKSPINNSDERTMAFAWMYRNLATGTMPPQAEVWHEGKCGRCGRKLTHPESLKSGIGPECATKFAAVAT